MHPILFHVGPITVYSFGVMLAVGVLLAAYVGARQAKRWSALGIAGVPTGAQVYDAVLVLLVGGLAGGRLLFVGLHWREYVSRPAEIFALWHGGLIFYGSVAGGWAALVWYLRRHRLSLTRMTDLLAPSVALGQAVGRVGCFLNGCCYGLPHHPVQLYESAACLALFVMLRAWQRSAGTGRWGQPGVLTAGYLVGYSALRWALEFWRGDNPVVWMGWTLPQVVSAALFLSAGGWLVRRLVSSSARRQ